MDDDNDVIAANLPLIFSNGCPMSLSDMSAEDCQYFLSFLMKCVLGDHITPSVWSSYPKPKWWPSKVPWSSIILTKKYRSKKWAETFHRLITSCYKSYGHSALLVFSKRLYQGLHKGWSYQYEENNDNTTTMYHTQTGRVLATFRGENRTYDSGLRISRPALLPRLNTPSPAKANARIHNNNNSHSCPAPKIAELPVDIYLCDYCTEGFSSETAVKNHEKICAIAANSKLAGTSQIDVSSHNQLSLKAATEEDPEGKTVDKAQFLCGFSLIPRNTKWVPDPSPCVPQIKAPMRLRTVTAVPFSSSRGRELSKSSRISIHVARAHVRQNDSYCRTRQSPVRAPLPRNGRQIPAPRHSRCWTVTYRKGAGKRPEEWSHLYTFNQRERLERMESIRNGLNRKSRKLLSLCKPELRIRLERLSSETIRFWTQPKSRPEQKLRQSSSVKRDRENDEMNSSTSSSTPVNTRRPGVVISPLILPLKQNPLAKSDPSEPVYILPDIPVSAAHSKEISPAGPSQEPILIDLCSSSDEEKSTISRTSSAFSRSSSRATQPESSANGRLSRNKRIELRNYKGERSQSTSYGTVSSGSSFPNVKDALSSTLSKKLKILMQDECKELRRNGLEHLLHSQERVTRKKASQQVEVTPISSWGRKKQ